MSEAFDDDSTRQESCDVNDYLPNSDQIFLDEGRSAATSQNPTNFFDWSFAKTDTDIKNDVLGHMQSNVGNFYSNTIAQYYYSGSMRNRIINHARTFLNDVKAINDAFIEKCVSSSDVNQGCNPFPTQKSTTKTFEISHTASDYNGEDLAFGKITFTVRYFTTSDSKLDISYTYSYFLFDYSKRIDKRNPINSQFFRQSFKNGNTMQTAIITKMKMRIETETKGKVEECYRDRCKLDTKVCTACIARRS